MNSFIKKIFEKGGDLSSDQLVHIQFQKFSRGEFKDKACVNVVIRKGKFVIATTSEYANEFVRLGAEIVGKNKVKVTGAVITTKNLKEIPEFAGVISEGKVKQFAGVKQFAIDKELSGEEILKLLDASPLAFFALSFSAGDLEIKIKAKAPKSGKPSTKSDEGPKVDFCKVSTTSEHIARSIAFDSEINFATLKKAEINNTFFINDIILPQNEKDFAKMRELAKRKGKIIRKVNIDGKEISKEKEFIA